MTDISTTSTLDEILSTAGPGPGAFRVAQRIECVDGFQISVQASAGHYCKDSTGRRPDLTSTPVMPWTAVEVGYPSERPEPWRCTAWHVGYDRHEDHPACDGWERYGDDDGTVDGDGASIYGFVPVGMVRALILSHGGEA